MKTIVIVLSGILLLAGSLGVAARPQTPATVQKISKATANKTASSNEGEKRFKENCGRCHNPPDSLSPREVKAVVQHMRVRAMLSAQDEQLILKYLAP
jgi:cytochrome c5